MSLKIIANSFYETLARAPISRILRAYVNTSDLNSLGKDVRSGCLDRANPDPESGFSLWEGLFSGLVS